MNNTPHRCKITFSGVVAQIACRHDGCVYAKSYLLDHTRSTKELLEFLIESGNQHVHRMWRGNQVAL